MKSDFWNPDVSVSRSTKPVGTPVTRRFSLYSSSILSKLSCSRSFTATKPLRGPPSEISNILCSARSMKPFTSSGDVYASSPISDVARIICRRSDFSRTMRAWYSTLAAVTEESRISARCTCPPTASRSPALFSSSDSVTMSTASFFSNMRYTAAQIFWCAGR